MKQGSSGLRTIQPSAEANKGERLVQVSVGSSSPEVTRPVTARRVQLPRPPQHLWSRPAIVGLAVVGMVAGSVALRLDQLTTAFWMDEGISVGIASHPLGRLPAILARDGSPPLYYVLLHGWMRVVGRSDVQTHVLSLLLALMAIPIGLWAGWSLFGRRAGWIMALLTATSPFLGEQSGETRMYTLVALLALVATASFLHGFAFGRRGYRPVFFASLLLLLYTHNWGLFFALAAGLAVVPCLFAIRDRNRALLDAVLGFGVVSLLYLPWIPTLLEQVRHTGAPWSRRPVVRELVSGLGAVSGDAHERVLVVLALTAAVVLVPMLRRVRTSEGAAVVAATVLAGVTLGAGWLSSQVKPAWTPRYFAVILPPVLLLAALGLARSGTRGTVGLVLILLFWIQPLGRLSGARPALARDDKAVDAKLAEIVRPELRPDDAVVAVQMEEVPVLHFYLGPDLRFADPTGFVADPAVADWRDATARMEAATTSTGLVPVLDSLPVSTRLLLVCPAENVIAERGHWFRLMENHCAEWKAAMAADRRFQPRIVPGLDTFSSAGEPEPFAWLYEKTAG